MGPAGPPGPPGRVSREIEGRDSEGGRDLGRDNKYGGGGGGYSGGGGGYGGGYHEAPKYETKDVAGILKCDTM